jgi:hypothetical protein
MSDAKKHFLKSVTFVTTRQFCGTIIFFLVNIKFLMMNQLPSDYNNDKQGPHRQIYAEQRQHRLGGAPNLLRWRIGRHAVVVDGLVCEQFYGEHAAFFQKNVGGSRDLNWLARIIYFIAQCSNGTFRAWFARRTQAAARFQAASTEKRRTNRHSPLFGAPKTQVGTPEAFRRPPKTTSQLSQFRRGH